LPYAEHSPSRRHSEGLLNGRLGRMLFDREQQDRAIDALRSRVAAMGAPTFKIKVLPKGMAKKGEASHAHD